MSDEIKTVKAGDGPKAVAIGKLHRWLEANEAKEQWSAQRSGVHVSCYLIKGLHVIVTVFCGRARMGWDLYIPAAPRCNKTAETLEAAAKAIGAGCVDPDGNLA